MTHETVLSESDEGKRVVNALGDDVGRVVEVREGVAYVEPDPTMTETLMSKLGWGEDDSETYRLEAENIDEVDDEAVHLAH